MFGGPNSDIDLPLTWSKALNHNYCSFSGVSFNTKGEKVVSTVWNANYNTGYIFVFNVISGALELGRSFPGPYRAYGFDT